MPHHNLVDIIRYHGSQHVLQAYWGSIIVWQLGGFGLILDAEYSCCKEISAVYGFCIATQLRNIGI